MVNQGLTTQGVIKQGAGFVPAPKKNRKEKKMEGFVKRESAGLAQTPQSEGINLLNMVEVRMKNLLQSLNNIESLTNNLNKNLLPMESQKESEANVEAKKPRGWLENHIENLELLINRAGKIHYHVQRLTQAMKTDKVGQ